MRQKDGRLEGWEQDEIRRMVVGGDQKNGNWRRLEGREWDETKRMVVV